MEYIINKNVFGEVDPHAYVIQSQKRDFTHAHCIFFLIESSKDDFLQPNDMNCIIVANIPGSKNQVLSDIIMKNNMHNPCWIFNPSLVCMVNGAGLRSFPK